MDNRAQSIGLARYFLGLAVGAIMIFIVGTVTSPILSGASEAGDATYASQATTWFNDGIGLLPIAFVLISVFGITALALYQRAGVR